MTWLWNRARTMKTKRCRELGSCYIVELLSTVLDVPYNSSTTSGSASCRRLRICNFCCASTDELRKNCCKVDTRCIPFRPSRYLYEASYTLTPSVYIPGRRRRSRQYAPDESEKKCFGEKFHAFLICHVSLFGGMQVNWQFLSLDIVTIYGTDCPWKQTISIYLLPWSFSDLIPTGNDWHLGFFVYDAGILILRKDVDLASIE